MLLLLEEKEDKNRFGIGRGDSSIQQSMINGARNKRRRRNAQTHITRL
jgi:hypothetical protein